jgi:hypothetical protein
MSVLPLFCFLYRPKSNNENQVHTSTFIIARVSYGGAVSFLSVTTKKSCCKYNCNVTMCATVSTTVT